MNKRKHKKNVKGQNGVLRALSLSQLNDVFGTLKR
jgi:hypothetical protein